MATVRTETTSIDQLNSFLRGEISAVETYRLALNKLEAGSAARPQLETCKESHAQRVVALRRRIMELGGTPADNAGAWGAFTKAVEGGAALFGDKLAIATLEEGEDHGLKDYRADYEKLDATSRDLIVGRLLPEQEQTHRMLSALKKQLQ